MKSLALAPHRLYFFLGASTLLLLFGWWWGNLNFSTYTALIPLHALLMPLGVFPLFILGFTFTAGPRWLGVQESDRYFLLNGGTYFAGITLVVLGSVLGWFHMRTSGFALMGCAWIAVTLRWARLVRMSPVRDKLHPGLLLLSMCCGLLALILAMLWSAGQTWAWLVARQVAFFAFLLPIFLTVTHRMLPFFSTNVLVPYHPWRPNALLLGWVAGCYTLVVAGVLDLSWLMAGVAAALALVFFYTSWRWGVLRSVQNRLLAMLHLAFSWLGLVFSLFSAAALGWTSTSVAFHALALGFMGTMMVGFVSRVSYGHSGRPLVAGTGLWAVYLGLHASALLRVFSGMANWSLGVSLSSWCWLALVLGWFAMMAPIYLRPRLDGQPG